jgi:thioesterase domain-containing protein
VAAFLAELRSRDVQVWAEGDRLRCTAPVGVLTGELRARLHHEKSEILAFLHAAQALAQQPPAIVPLQPRGSRTPIFGVPGHNGDVFCYRALVQALGDDQPFFGLHPPGLDGQSAPLTRVEDLAGYFADQIRAFRPHGPYIITGFCAGGAVAFELGRQLQQGGAATEFVALFGSPYPTWYRFPTQLRRRLAQEIDRFWGHARALASLSKAERRRYVTDKLRQREANRAAATAALNDPVLIRRAHVERATVAAVRRYTPPHFAGRLGVFLPCEAWLPSAAPLWRSVAQQIEVYFGPQGCDNDNMLRESYAPVFAECFRRCRERSDNGERVSRPSARDTGPRREASSSIGTMCAVADSPRD